MATNEKPDYTGIDKIDHLKQYKFEETERNRAMRMFLEEQRQEQEIETPKEETKITKTASLGTTRPFGSAGVVALLAAMAAEQMSTTMSRNAASKRTGTVTPHDGRVKRSNLTREDFPSRQAWRAHQREQEKADKKGLLYG